MEATTEKPVYSYEDVVFMTSIAEHDHLLGDIIPITADETPLFSSHLQRALAVYLRAKGLLVDSFGQGDPWAGFQFGSYVPPERPNHPHIFSVRGTNEEFTAVGSAIRVEPDLPFPSTWKMELRDQLLCCAKEIERVLRERIASAALVDDRPKRIGIYYILFGFSQCTRSTEWVASFDVSFYRK
jgi:hypothetical protein